MSPTPESGTLHTTNGRIGCFQQVNFSGLPLLSVAYRLTSVPGIPNIIGAIFQTFITTSGGAALSYDFGSGVTAEWYLMPTDPTPEVGRWIGGPGLVMAKSPVLLSRDTLEPLGVIIPAKAMVVVIVKQR